MLTSQSSSMTITSESESASFLGPLSSTSLGPSISTKPSFSKRLFLLGLCPSIIYSYKWLATLAVCKVKHTFGFQRQWSLSRRFCRQIRYRDRFDSSSWLRKWRWQDVRRRVNWMIGSNHGRAGFRHLGRKY